MQIDTSSIGHEDLARYSENRTGIYAEISAGRRHHDSCGAARFDDTRTEAEWRDYISHCMASRGDFRAEMLKAAALAVAAIEAHDRKAGK